MVLKEVGVLAIATLSALAAGGGMMKFGPYALPQAHEGRVIKSADGHYWATAEVNGAPIRFLVDTGASAVSLTEADAAKLGIDLSGLKYDRPVYTAAGRQRAAPVTLDHVDVDGTRIDHVKAVVMQGALPASLLGMSYLGRLSSFRATPEALVLSR